MVKVKPISVAKSNYSDSTALVPKRFEDGVKVATWHDAAIAGQDLYEAQMARPEILARRASGIDKVSDESWRRATIDKGKAIIGARMKAATDKWATEFAPFATVLEGLTLEPRTTDPATNVANRVTPIAVALAKKKEELST